jgi:hypothetical protein
LAYADQAELGVAEAKPVHPPAPPPEPRDGASLSFAERRLLFDRGFGKNDNNNPPCDRPVVNKKATARADQQTVTPSPPSVPAPRPKPKKRQVNEAIQARIRALQAQEHLALNVHDSFESDTDRASLSSSSSHSE